MSGKQEEFDFGRQARDEGIARVLSHTPLEWALKLHFAFWMLVDSGDRFTAEDARPICGSPPNHHNAFGAVWHILSARALKEGRVAVVGHTRTKRRSSHRRRLPVYQNLNNQAKIAE